MFALWLAALPAFCSGLLLATACMAVSWLMAFAGTLQAEADAVGTCWVAAVPAIRGGVRKVSGRWEGRR